MTRPRRRSQPARQYPRVARVGELLREIVAEELERIADPRLELVTVTEARVDTDLKRAIVWVSSLEGPERDDEMLAALAELRPRLQAAYARQARTRSTPELVFRPDDVARAAARIDELLRDLPEGSPEVDESNYKQPVEVDDPDDSHYLDDLEPDDLDEEADGPG